MKRLIYLLLFTCLASTAIGQQLLPAAANQENRVLTSRAWQAKFTLILPGGATPAFPAYVPDSLKAKALFIANGTNSSYPKGVYYYDEGWKRLASAGELLNAMPLSDSTRFLRYVTNGLNYNSSTGTAGFGGTLTQSTVLNAGFDYSFTINNGYGSAYFGSNKIDLRHLLFGGGQLVASELSLEDGGITLGIYDGNSGKNALFGMGTGGFGVTDDFFHRGIINMGDYESNFVPRSLVTKQFVEGKITSAGSASDAKYKLKDDTTSVTGYQTVGGLFPKSDSRYAKKAVATLQNGSKLNYHDYLLSRQAALVGISIFGSTSGTKTIFVDWNYADGTYIRNRYPKDMDGLFLLRGVSAGRSLAAINTIITPTATIQDIAIQTRRLGDTSAHQWFPSHGGIGNVARNVSSKWYINGLIVPADSITARINIGVNGKILLLQSGTAYYPTGSTPEFDFLLTQTLDARQYKVGIDLTMLNDSTEIKTGYLSMIAGFTPNMAEMAIGDSVYNITSGDLPKVYVKPASDVMFSGTVSGYKYATAMHTNILSALDYPHHNLTDSSSFIIPRVGYTKVYPDFASGLIVTKAGQKFSVQNEYAVGRIISPTDVGVDTPTPTETPITSGTVAGGALSGTYPNPTIKAVVTAGSGNYPTINAAGQTIALGNRKYMALDDAYGETALASGFGSDCNNLVKNAFVAIASGATNKPFTNTSFIQVIAATTSMVTQIGYDRTGLQWATRFYNGTTWTAWATFANTAGQAYVFPTTGGTLLSGLKGSATLDFPSTAAGDFSDLTITVTGAAVGDIVSVGAPSVTSTGRFSAFVSVANTVTVRFIPSATEDPASGTFKVTVLK